MMDIVKLLREAGDVYHDIARDMLQNEWKEHLAPHYTRRGSELKRAAAELEGDAEPVAFCFKNAKGEYSHFSATQHSPGMTELYLHPPTERVPEGMMLFPKAAWKFLTGAGTLDGVWFGEKHSSQLPFWWRSYIRKLLAAAPGAGGDSSDGVGDGVVNKEQREKLRELALEATPGEWKVASDLPAYAIYTDSGRRVVQTPNQNNRKQWGTSDDTHGIDRHSDAAYIAAANPVAVLALLDRIDELEGMTPTERAVPEGWQLVPVELTDKMMDAMYDIGIDEDDDDLQEIYKAMLAAAPGAGGDV